MSRGSATALEVGRAAPDFCLPAGNGDTSCLRDALGHGPVLLWLYRGSACLHCRDTLAKLRDRHAELEERHVRVIAVSPDHPARAAELSDELGLPFEVLGDPEREVARAYGTEAGGDVRPGAYLIDPRGRVQWSWVGRSAEDQPRIATVFGVLRGRHRLPIPAPSDFLTPAFAAAAAVVFLLLGMLASQANLDLLPWDVPIRRWVRDLGADRTQTFMEAVTDLGSRWLIVALTIPMAVIGWRRCRQIVVVLIVALPAALLIELSLKAIVDRPRPPFGQGFGASFPSGHVLGATAFWGLVPPWIYLVTKRRWAWVSSVALAAIVLFLVGASRVYLGAHWPSDVAGGYLAGAIFLLAAEWMVRRPIAALRCGACDFHPLRSLVHHRPDQVRPSTE